MAKIALPSFYSVSRAIQYTDGILTGLKSDGTTVPLVVREFSTRGAKSSHGDAYKLSKNDAKVTKDINSPNPQVVDGVFLDFEMDRLRLSFGANIHAVSVKKQACNDFAFTEKVDEFLNLFQSSSGFKSLAELFAWRIACGAALWRNYSGVNRLVSIRTEGKEWVFNADELNTSTPPEKGLVTTKGDAGELIALIDNALGGKRDVLMLMVDTDITIGNGQEVFPSQELEMKKERNSKSKVLYSAPYRGTQTAAMHPQKIGAAIRAIDLWHPEYKRAGPLSIEPLGYSHQHQQSFRTPDTGTDLYSYLQGIDNLIGELKQGTVTDQARYLAACFIRGGVFSGSPDAEQKAKDKAEKDAAKAAAKGKKAKADVQPDLLEAQPI